MKSHLCALVAGFIFSLGLGISGMTQPQKVVGFLDLFGNWDPSLIFVMVGAILVHFLFFKLLRGRTSPLFSKEWHLPQKTRITPSLMICATIFGVGWGLGGYCPGPAIAALATTQWRPALFFIGMVAGMFLFRKINAAMNFNR